MVGPWKVGPSEVGWSGGQEVAVKGSRISLEGVYSGGIYRSISAFWDLFWGLRQLQLSMAGPRAGKCRRRRFLAQK